MIEITYSFYSDEYGGSLISSENFDFILDRAIDAVKAYAFMGPDRAMNVCNTKPKPEEK